MSDSVSRLALGTAQFGMRYGVANAQGMPDANEVTAILHLARARGMDTLDTAIAYGESERTLGRAGVSEWRVVTKLPPLPADCEDVDAWVRDSVADSLARVGVPRLAGLLLHRSADLAGPRGARLAAALRAAREAEHCEKVGVSIYDPSELDATWPVLAPDLVQAPFNVFDRRLESSGWLARLASHGVEVHTRSAFLQGLLLMSADRRPARFAKWAPLLAQWDTWVADQGMPALQACLSFVLRHPQIDRVVVGVDGAGHLREVLDAAGAGGPVAPASLATSDLNLIEPSRWVAA